MGRSPTRSAIGQNGIVSPFEKAVKSTQSISPIPAAKGAFPAGFEPTGILRSSDGPRFPFNFTKKASVSPQSQELCEFFFPGFPVRKYGAAQLQVVLKVRRIRDGLGPCTGWLNVKSRGKTKKQKRAGETELDYERRIMETPR
jgi:hypothetical protein